MQALVVWAHPERDSLSGALCDTAVAALRRAGHRVEVIDLYGDGFSPAMSEAEWLAYRELRPALDEQTTRYALLVRSAEILVFIYPTWWSGLPAILKGFLERVLVPDVAFALDPVSRRVRGQLTQVRRLVGITTYGTPRRFNWLTGEPGRRTVTRTVRLVCGWRCRTTWLALHGLDSSSPDSRQAFLARVDAALGQGRSGS